MRQLFVVLALLLAVTASAQVPYRITTVQAVADADPARFRCAHTPAACGRDFIKALACELHKTDPRFGLNGKRGNPNDISYDAINFKGEGPDVDPTAGNAPRTVIDVIGGAGGPNPVVAWFVVSDAKSPTGAAWVQPCGSSTTPPPAKPVYPPYAGDEVFDAVGLVLFLDYTEAGQPPNIGMGRWFARTIYDWVVGNTPTLQDSITKHRKEWRDILGLPPLP